ncbi:hypothetical protein [Kordiimonas pumila]|uniref:Membrane protein YkvI n=1 Tax=Kordiimonas pumila TaxID=2161677 RepID=A0ABV7D528_9PROT|nr:hypothetical protein [Kordiimonas pumila]
MAKNTRSLLALYVLPGLVMQSIVIGGGYGTGREIAEFLLSEGPYGGLFALLAATLVWSAALAISFELARVFKAYDYISFIKCLLGPGWIMFEAVYLLGTVLVLSIVGAASGELFHSLTGAPTIVGVVLAMVSIAYITYRGSEFIKRLFAAWSILIYIAYGILIFITVSRYGESIFAQFKPSPIEFSWFFSGAKYAALNAGIIPAALFCVVHLQSKKNALISGALSGPIIMAPALLLFLSLLSQYPLVMSEPIPTNTLLQVIDMPVFSVFFQILLIGTVINTGAAFIHGFNERVNQAFHHKKKPFTALHRSALSIGITIISVFAAERVGLIDLVSKGYGAFTLVSLAVFIVPVLTVGAWRVVVPRKKASKD